MKGSGWIPQEIDPTKPSVARIYDYYLGGSHNLDIDREQARQAIAQWPELPKIMRTNRAFVQRAVRFCLTKGVRHFRATNTVEQDSFLGIPSHGRRQVFTAMFIHHITGGLISQTWRNAGDLGRLHQLGARIEPSRPEK